jgi:predicted nucleic acid-binding protein
VSNFLLDTGPLAAYLQGRPGAVALIDPWLNDYRAQTSILVYGEITEYVRSLADPVQKQDELRRLLRVIRPKDLSYPILERYAAIRRSLRPPHGPGLIGDIDTLIAATAMERDLILVTTDSDYTRVDGLRIQLLARRTYLPIGSLDS